MVAAGAVAAAGSSRLAYSDGGILFVISRMSVFESGREFGQRDSAGVDVPSLVGNLSPAGAGKARIC
jgi:hypothetical protein